MSTYQEQKEMDYLPFELNLGDEMYDCWATERGTIRALAEEVKAAKSLAESLAAIDKSLRYFLTIELYLRANPDCYKSICATVYKLMQTPHASPLLVTILETEKFLANIRSPTFAELSAQFETAEASEEEAAEVAEAPDSSQTGWPRSDRSIATLAAQAAAAGNAAEAETLRCVALLFADMRKAREEAEKAEEAAEAAEAKKAAAAAAETAKMAAEAAKAEVAEAAKMAAEAAKAEAAEAEADAMACCSGCVRQLQGELLAVEKGAGRKEIAAQVFAEKPTVSCASLASDAATAAALVRARARMEKKEWGTLPYITDEDFARYLNGELPIEATEMAFGNMEFFIWTRGLATYKLSRLNAAAEACYVEEISGGANPCFLRPFRIDLHSEEGRAAYAAGKPLRHPLYPVEKRSWWSRLFLCRTVAVEK